MKTIQVPKPVRDVDGLLERFRQEEPPFGIVSVGADPRNTYVYLEDSEERDPAPVVNAWIDVPELRVSSNGQTGQLGVAEVVSNGVDVHTVLIQKTDPAGNVVGGFEKLSVTAQKGVKISNASPKLSDGMAMVQVGPSDKAGELMVEVRDRSGKMKPVKLPLRFIKKNIPKEDVPNDAAALSPIPIEGGGIMATIRRILGI